MKVWTWREDWGEAVRHQEPAVLPSDLHPVISPVDFCPLLFEMKAYTLSWTWRLILNRFFGFDVLGHYDTQQKYKHKSLCSYFSWVRLLVQTHPLSVCSSHALPVVIVGFLQVLRLLLYFKKYKGLLANLENVSIGLWVVALQQAGEPCLSLKVNWKRLHSKI